MSEKSNDAKAGAPKRLKAPGAVRAAAAAPRPGRPTAVQLDERDWNKAGPRREAGPPLSGGAPDVAAKALSPHKPPPATDPEG